MQMQTAISHAAQTLNIGAIVQKETACELCGEVHLRIVSHISRSGEALTTGLCTGCGLVQSYPIPSEDELKHYYASHYRSDYKKTVRPKRKHLARYARNAVARLHFFKNHVPVGAKLLDVGSGSGEFGYTCTLANFEVTGLEPHVQYAAYTADTFNYNVINSGFESADIAPETYDVITLHHVLEHLPSPYAALKKLHAWLRVGGVIVVDVPNIEAMKHAPANRFHYAHIYNFNLQTLAAYLNKAGFEMVQYSTDAGISIVARKVRAAEDARYTRNEANYQRLWNMLSEQHTLRHYATPMPYKRLLGKMKRFAREWWLAKKPLGDRELVHFVYDREVQAGGVMQATRPKVRWVVAAVASALLAAEMAS